MRPGRPRPGPWANGWIASVLALGACATHRPAPVQWSSTERGLEYTSFEEVSKAVVWAVRFDQRRFATALVWSVSGLKVPDSIGQDFAATVNGGYFEQDLRPSGLLIVDGRQVGAANGGSGALTIDGDGWLNIVRSKAVQAAEHGSVLQAWPFLIEPGGANGIRHDDGRRSRRTAVGIDAARRGLFISVPREGVSLFELMGICRRLGAEVAVNLTGDPRPALR
ncbi:MAG: phosphodiester glycosidase family protein [Deltaproteobacteria bacterium]